MQCTGAKILMECLVEQGVDTIFGYPGGTILNVYDELYNYEGDGRIKHILTAHEQGACHAADGYARSTGRVGVCFATSGPGCTNLVTGIATAYMDSSPIVCITCNVGTSLLGKDSFQEVDITGITMPITKCNYLVRSVDELADVVREAFAIARSGRPGPVLIDIPKNVTAEKADYEPLPRSAHGTSGRLGKLMKRSSQNFKAPEPDHRDIDKLVEMIAASKKPLLICGGGVVRGRADKQFREFAWSDLDSLTMHQSARIERTEKGFQICIYNRTDYDALLAMLENRGFSLPTADEWAYLCGGGCRTLFPWGDGLDYSMRLHWFEDMDEDENRPYDMEEPNFFGLSIAYDPYMREVVQADRLTTCGGDGGCNICGGLGPFLGFLPCSPHCKPEVQEDNELNGDYDFYRPIIRLENHD